MSRQNQGRTRALTIGLLAVAILAALAITTGGSLPGLPGGSSGGALPTQAPVLKAGTTPTSGSVQGIVRVMVEHLRDHTWKFTYKVHNTGKTPIAGFQFNAPQSNLFHVWGRPGWRYFGSGICGGSPRGVLVYWSTGTTSRFLLPPGKTGQFGFTVNTTGAKPLQYSLSWTSASPQFGTVTGPAPSALPPTGLCNR